MEANFTMKFQPVIGLEVHVELATNSKMFCGCPVVDSVEAEPNIAVCPVCSGMPGALPVANERAVEYGIRVGLALGCTIQPTSIFARKNYFYPDMPKAYQISQFEDPLATDGTLIIKTEDGSEKTVRVLRAHLEEDAGKLTHIEGASLVDLNRAGVPLLEIVSMPDMHSAIEARSYAENLRDILRYLGVNSGDMEKGVIRFEANISVRPEGTEKLGTRTEVKNLNSFRAMEDAINYEIERQSKLIEAGGEVDQVTMGWDEAKAKTYTMRGKEDSHDYRYFPEPDLPPLKVDDAWRERVLSELPELPRAKFERFVADYELTEYDAGVLVAEKTTADYFESALKASSQKVTPKMVANWMTGDLFALMNQNDVSINALKLQPAGLAELVSLVAEGEINQKTAKEILAEVFESGASPKAIVAEKGLGQVSDGDLIGALVAEVVNEHQAEVTSYREGKEGIANWLFGQVMKKARGRANPQVLREELMRQLKG
ncbi:MAG: Asp-tRNA(Asn)/Glu-tRNA(Gln) amidotransferase subunit GatB [Anaerolineae bacterium]|jgi:aspartyl-tRNA(Asn)/glutamyl-tRNA(Gln) amidotransferase subunit B|nr:Asp-tRNA(Asn)/Glu-tRNA(Gln) amidotransferase subunit GatB [Anaerolineae bacterium]MBT7070878.1 Asp-tRNA(Asn)/Glu-tRNA(Gln) amidotransferase subunit GatB [Anaerolineae bacterium]MBT7326402.1 Asp-tRNA(Asn)/Glu-tRNA(Gln) amidotransferase subunit GatB [Anaerolineae bacterium]